MLAPRPAGPADVEAITALVREAYAKYLPRMGQEPKPMTADYGRAVAEHQMWVVEEDGRLAAVLELIPEQDYLMIENIAVVPEMQGRGMGRELMAFAEAEARRRDLPEMRLYTHETMVENIALYTRLGYRETAHKEVEGFRRRPFCARAGYSMVKPLAD